MTEGAGGDLVLAGNVQLDNFGTGGTITLGSNNSINGTVVFQTLSAGADATLVNGQALTLAGATVGGNLTVSATGGMTIAGTVTSPGTIALNAIPGSGSAPLDFLSGAANVQAPVIDLNATGMVLVGNAMLGETGATIDLAHTTSGGAVTEASGAKITASALGATNGLAGNVSLTGLGNAIAGLSGIAVSGSGNGIAVSSIAPTLSVNGALSTTNGPVTLDAGPLILGAAISAPGNTVTLGAGTISQTGGTITAATLTGVSGGDTVLNQANAIGSIGPFTVGVGNLSVFDGAATNLTVGGALSASGKITLAANATPDPKT